MIRVRIRPSTVRCFVPTGDRIAPGPACTEPSGKSAFVRFVRFASFAEFVLSVPLRAVDPGQHHRETPCQEPGDRDPFKYFAQTGFA